MYGYMVLSCRVDSEYNVVVLNSFSFCLIRKEKNRPIRLIIAQSSSHRVRNWVSGTIITDQFLVLKYYWNVTEFY